MRTAPVILMTLLFICLGFSQLRAESETEKSHVPAAKGWLSLIDSGNYSSSWNEASTYFRGAVTAQTWEKSLEGVRMPFGKLVSRRILTMQESSALPGAPDGKYAVMTFRTAFEHKRDAIETVTLMFDNDGKWRAAGYFIK
jgi:hypothetical protein